MVGRPAGGPIWNASGDRRPAVASTTTSSCLRGAGRRRRRRNAGPRRVRSARSARAGHRALRRRSAARLTARATVSPAIAIVPVMIRATRIASISRTGPVIAPRTVVIPRTVIIAVAHVHIGLWDNRHAVRVVTVISAVAVAVHRCVVRIDSTAAEESGEGDGGQRCKAFHFKPEAGGFIAMRPQLCASVALALYAFVRTYFSCQAALRGCLPQAPPSTVPFQTTLYRG